jgi:hypothetical protein
VKISDFVLNEANKSYFLPAIQREFVWFKNMKDEKVEKLFDSLLQEYPIGNLLIWEYNKIQSDRTPFEVYNLIQSWDEDNPHNTETNLNGVSKMYLILDGQQRLTSLLIGLKGKRTYTKYKSKKEEKLFLNLLSNIENERDNIYGLKYELKFLTPFDVNYENEHYPNRFWFEIGKVLDYQSKTAEDLKEDYEDDIQHKVGDNIDLKRKALRTLGQIHNVICVKDVLIESKVGSGRTEDQILDIFVRTNQGGTVLEKADMLLSYMENDNSLFGPKGARTEITGFTDSLNEEKVDRPSYDLDKDFVLKAALVLSGLDIRYNLKNFNKANLIKISNNWDTIKKYLTIAVDFLGHYKFTKKNITANNAIIPIAYYLMHKKLDSSIINSTDSNEATMREDIIKWFSTALLEGILGGSSDTTLENIRKEIDSGKKLTETLKYILERSDLERIVKTSNFGHKNTLLILLLISESKYWEYDVDHIYPQALFERKKLKEQLQLPDDEINRFLNYENKIGNLELLPRIDNERKLDEPPIDWFKKQEKDYFEKFLIPKLENYDFSNFIEFVNKREELIIDKLSALFKVKT